MVLKNIDTRLFTWTPAKQIISALFGSLSYMIKPETAIGVIHFAFCLSLKACDYNLSFTQLNKDFM